MRAHGFLPVARQIGQAAVSVRRRCSAVRSARVKAGPAGENDWPVIVIKLVGKEECAGKAVILCSVMAIVLMRGDGIASKAAVLRHVRRQTVIVAEKYGLTVTGLHQFGWYR